MRVQYIREGVRRRRDSNMGEEDGAQLERQMCHCAETSRDRKTAQGDRECHHQIAETGDRAP